jgi:hypothetical protein
VGKAQKRRPRRRQNGHVTAPFFPRTKKGHNVLVHGIRYVGYMRGLRVVLVHERVRGADDLLVLLFFRFAFAGAFAAGAGALSFACAGSSGNSSGVGPRMMGVGPEKSLPVRRDSVEMSVDGQ